MEEKCVYCKHSTIIIDNHNEITDMCTCRESRAFLQEIDLTDSCECFEEEQMETLPFMQEDDQIQ